MTCAQKWFRQQFLYNISIAMMRQSIDLPDKDECDNLQLIPHHQPKVKNQTTTKCSLVTTPEFDFQSCVVDSTDFSFQVEMHRENAMAIKTAATKYLQECLTGDYSIQLGFKDATLYPYKQHPSDVKEGCVLDELITQNELFGEETKIQIYGILKEQENLTRFLREIPEIFGLTVGKQMVYLIYRIFKEKVTSYTHFIQQTHSLIPKFTCLQDLDQDSLRTRDNSCPVYEDIDMEEVVAFAEGDIEEIASRLYFADIKILNLRHITAEISPKANLYKEFATLIKRISKSVFLTLAGGIDPGRQNCSFFDIPREVSFTEFSEVGLSIQKSLSRPSVPYEDEEGDVVSKKLKFE